MKHLLIDIGSTNIKFAVSDGGALSETEKTPFPAPAVDDGVHFEVEISGILAKIFAIADKTESDDIFISTQMHGYLLADSRSRPLTRYISWQDRRAAEAQVRLFVGKESGTSMKDNLPRAGVEAIKKEQPALFAQAEEFFTLGSFVAHALTGRNVTHITDAAASGYYDVKRRISRPSELRLPEAEYAVRAAGTYRGRKVYAPFGDQQCAVLGAVGGENCYILNLGTAAQMCAVADGFAEGDFESRPYFGGKTLCTVTGLSGGKTIGDGEEPNLAERLAKEYAEALSKLPPRGELLITGGVTKYHEPLIRGVAERMGLPYRLNGGADALEGLNKLSEESEK